MVVSAGAPKASKDMNTIVFVRVGVLLPNTNSSLIGPDGPPSRIRSAPPVTISGNKNWMPGPAYAAFRVHEPVPVSARTTHCPFSLNEIEKGSRPAELPGMVSARAGPAKVPIANNAASEKLRVKDAFMLHPMCDYKLHPMCDYKN
jgi:hypothetical protein